MNFIFILDEEVVVAPFSSLEVVDALFPLLVPAEVVLHLSSLAVVLKT